MFFYMLAHHFCKILILPFLWIVYPTKVLNKVNLPRNKSLLIVCNHMSWIDVLLLWAKIPGWRRFVAKKEAGKGVFKFFVLGTGTIFVNRDGSDFKAIKKCITVLKKGQGLNFFPEGTRNKVNEDLQQLKGGVSMLAIKSSATIVPMSILHKAKPWHKNYISIGEAFNLNEYNGIANKANIEEGNQKIYDRMKQVQVELRESKQLSNKTQNNTNTK